MRKEPAYDKWNISVFLWHQVMVAATLYQRNADMNYKLCDIRSTERYISYTGATGMLLHINGKITMGNLNSSLMS
jgi:hypothetical protein